MIVAATMTVRTAIASRTMGVAGITGPSGSKAQRKAAAERLGFPMRSEAASGGLLSVLRDLSSRGARTAGGFLNAALGRSRGNIAAILACA